MISEIRVWLVVAFVVFVQVSLTVCLYYKTPTVKLSFGVFSSALPDILPYAVIERIQMEQNARFGRKISSKSSITPLKAASDARYPAPPSPPHQLPVPAHTHKHDLVNTRRQNNGKSERTRSKLGGHAYLQQAAKNTQLLRLYDEDGEHMLNLRIDKAEDGGGARAQHRRQNILLPVQAAGDSKRERHYWLEI